MSADAWSSTQYEKFRQERLQPFFDLLSLIKVKPSMQIIDLGCGTGEITNLLAQHLPHSSVVGLDSSENMLAKARATQALRVTFALQQIEAVKDFGQYDLVFSHAALQWVPENEALLNLILSQLKPGAQLAVQLPQNEAHLSHYLAAQIAKEEPFVSWLSGYVRETHALSLERYSELLYHGGCIEQACFAKIYGHTLPSSIDVVEWVKGTLLTAYTSKLQGQQQQDFLDEYTRRLLSALGEQRPYFYPFRRALFYGIKG
jgi:trans-aconitate 2-methyltransferase